MKNGFINYFNGSHFCKSIGFFIFCVFLVQSCIWMRPPPSVRSYPVSHLSSAAKYQGILFVMAEAFNNAIDLFLLPEAYAAPPNVICVPWYPTDLLVPHETWPGKQTILKGIARVTDNNLSGGTYYWDFGDGTSSSPVGISNPDNLSITHTYNVTPGTLIIARLHVTDTAGEVSSDEYRILVKEKTLDVEVNKAIDDGLWWLYTQKESIGSSSFRWNNSRYGNHYANTTASAVQAFEINGHLETRNLDEDPYVNAVLGGIDYLMTTLIAYNMSLQDGEDPDSNHNGIGLSVNSYRPIYELGAVMDAFVASGTPDAIARAGGANVIGRRYQDIVQDMVDMYSWGQSELGSFTGGWRYSWNADSDNSAAQWGAIGMIPAERHFGCIIPQWVKDRNNSWLNNSYNSAGYFGYTNPWPNRDLSNGPSGMLQLSFAGKDITDSRWIACERYIENNWNSFLNTGRDCRYYSYYAFTKAMRLALPQEVTHLATTGLDWYGDETRGMARLLVNTQYSNGSWPYDGWPYVGEQTAAGWSIIILTRTLFERPPVAIIHASPNPGAIGQLINLDASDSYHMDPSKEITGYLWDFDASDGVDFDHPDASGIQTNTTFDTLGDYVISLKVIDNSIPARFDISTLTIRITIPPHAPTAVVGGPYISAVGEEVYVDGSGSYDVDEPEGDSITAWDWETDLVAPYDFAEAHGEKALLPPYSSAGHYDIALRVTDNTAAVFPTSGQPNLTHVAYGGITVYKVGVTNLQARPKATKCQLTLAHKGLDSYEVLRSEKGTNEGYELIGTTNSTYSTYIDYNVELNKDYWYRIRTRQNGEVFLSGPVHVNSIGRIRNNPPVITSTPVADAQEAMLYQYDVEASDPEGTDLTYILDQSPDDMSIDAATGLITWTPDRDQVGINDVTVRVQDVPGTSATQFFHVLVAPRPNTSPVSDPDGPYSGLINEVITFDGSGSSDPEDDPIADYHWVFGDGTETHGLQVTHIYTASNIYIVTLYVTDDRGATGSAETACQIEAPNQPPAANAGSPYSGHTWEIITFNGSGSSDPDGDSLTYTWNFGDSTPPQTDISVSHIYSLDGTYTVTLTVDDGRGGLDTDSIDVSIGPFNEAPIAQLCQGGSIPQTFIDFEDRASLELLTDQYRSLGILISGDSSWTGRVITIPSYGTAFFGNSGPNTMYFGESTTITFVKPGTDTPTVADNISMLVGDGDFSPETFSVKFLDLYGNLLSSETYSTFTDGELIQFSDTAASVILYLESDSVSGAVLDNFSFNILCNPFPEPFSINVGAEILFDGSNSHDSDGDIISYDWDFGDGIVTTGMVATNTFNSPGNYTISLTVTDNDGATDSEAVSAHVNVPPELNSVPGLTTREDILYIYDVEADDEDGDTLIFALSSAPSGMTIAPDTGLIQWLPTQADVGAHNVIVTVSDGHGGTGTQSYTLVVSASNSAPQITSEPIITAIQGQPYTYAVEASDPDDDPIKFSLDTAPSGMTIAPDKRLIQWTPTETDLGNHIIKIRARDFYGAFVLQEFTINVSEATSPASIQVSLNQHVQNAGKTLSFSIAVLDTNGEEIKPTPDLEYEIIAYGRNSGTLPTVEGTMITAYSDTLGSYKLKCSIPDTDISAEDNFVIIIPADSMDTQANMFGTLSKDLKNTCNIIGDLAQSLENGETGAIPMPLNNLTAVRDNINLFNFHISTPFAPEKGFLPSPAELTSAGYPPTSDDAMFLSVIESIADNIQQTITFLNNLDPLNLSYDDKEALTELYTDLDVLSTQLSALNPSINGIVAVSSRINQLLADIVPEYLHTLINNAEAALKQNGLASNITTPFLMYTGMGALTVSTGKPMSPVTFYSQIQPAFFGLIGLFSSMSIQVRLVEIIYTECFRYLENAIIIMAGHDLLKMYENDASIYGIVTGASSSINIFNAGGSIIEGTIINSIPSLNDVILVGPNAFNAMRDNYIDAFKPREINSLEDIYNYIKNFYDIVESCGQAKEEAYQPPSAIYDCFISGSRPPCYEAYYDSGFRSVYTCTSWFCVPSPILLIVHNRDNGKLAFRLYSFMPTF